MRKPLRSIAVFAVLLLLGTSALAPRLRASSASYWPTSWNCTSQLFDGSGSSLIEVSQTGAIAQPFAITGNVAACSLQTSPFYAYGVLRVLQWNTAAMMPDPTTVALRSLNLTATRNLFAITPYTFSPPVVTRALAGVAEPPAGDGAIEVSFGFLFGTPQFKYAENGASSMPAGVYRAGAGAFSALPGPHGVHAMSACAGDPSVQNLRVVQSVMRTDDVIDETRYELVQRFRVPRAVRLRWIEAAVDGYTTAPFAATSIGVFGPLPAGAPPLTLPPPLAEAGFYPAFTSPAWEAPFDFDSTVVLVPGTDYWLHLTPAHRFRVKGRHVSAQESPEFAAAIGPLYSRTEPSGAWTQEIGEALCFRVIGDAAGGTLDAADAPGRSPLELRATPNPSRGTSVLAWSGAVGSVRFEVLDARGRRVGAEARALGVSGQWTWVAASAGRPLAPGLYFVRASDGAGHTATARVALVR